MRGLGHKCKIKDRKQVSGIRILNEEGINSNRRRNFSIKINRELKASWRGKKRLIYDRRYRLVVKSSCKKKLKSIFPSTSRRDSRMTSNIRKYKSRFYVGEN